MEYLTVEIYYKPAKVLYLKIPPHPLETDVEKVYI